jgi:hypothetical protein
MARRGYSPEFRMRVIELVEGGRKVAERIGGIGVFSGSGLGGADGRPHGPTRKSESGIGRISPRSAISLLNSGDLPTCYLAGVAETQLKLPIPGCYLDFPAKDRSRILQAA